MDVSDAFVLQKVVNWLDKEIFQSDGSFIPYPPLFHCVLSKFWVLLTNYTSISKTNSLEFFHLSNHQQGRNICFSTLDDLNCFKLKIYHLLSNCLDIQQNVFFQQFLLSQQRLKLGLVNILKYYITLFLDQCLISQASISELLLQFETTVIKNEGWISLNSSQQSIIGCSSYKVSINIFKIFEVFILLWNSFHSELFSDVNFKSHYFIYFIKCISAMSPQDLRRALVDFVCIKVTNIYNSIHHLSSLSFLNSTVSSPFLDFLFHNPNWVFNHIECLIFTKLIFNSIKKQNDSLHSSYLDYKKYFSCNFNTNLINLERDIVQISFHSSYFLKCIADENTNKIDSDTFKPSSMRFKISAKEYLKAVHSILNNEVVIISFVEVNSDLFERISYPDWIYFNNFSFGSSEGLKFNFYLSLLQPECLTNICSHYINDFYNYELRQILFKTDALLYNFLFKTQMIKFDFYNWADLLKLVFEDFESYSSDMNYIKCEDCMRDSILDLNKLSALHSSFALQEFQKGLICIHFHFKVLYDAILNTLHIWQSNEAYHRKLL